MNGLVIGWWAMCAILGFGLGVLYVGVMLDEGVVALVACYLAAVSGFGVLSLGLDLLR